MQISLEIAELYRRLKKREQLADFFSPEPYQMACYLSTARIQIVHAGNRGGKTKLMAKKFCDIMTHRHPTINREGPQCGRIVAESFKIMSRAIVPLLREFLPTHCLSGKDFNDSFNFQEAIVYLRDGGTIQLMSYSQEVDAFRSVPLDIIWNDEQGPVQIFDENLSRLGDKRGLCLNTLTPEKGANFLHQRYTCRAKPGSGIEFFQFDMLQNPYVDREYQVRSMALMPARKRRIKLYGDVIAMNGLIYEEFDPRVHTCTPFKIPNRWQLFIGIDLGWQNPTAVLFVVMNPLGELYVVEEHYEVHELISATAEFIRTAIEERYRSLTYRFCVIDSRSANATARQTGKTDLQTFIRAFSLGSVRGSSCKGNAVLERINRVHELLLVNPETKQSALKVFKTCIHTIEEFGLYAMRESQLDGDGNVDERPMDKNDHCMSALGIMAENKPRFVTVNRDYSESEPKSPYRLGGIV